MIRSGLDGELAALLARLNLAQYSEAFARERITMRSAGELSDADLKELGLMMGERKQLQLALRKHASEGTSAAAYS